jgi:hypothetical protein
MRPEVPPLQSETPDSSTSSLGGFVEFIADTLQPQAEPAANSWEHLSHQLRTIQRGLVDVIQEHTDGRSCLSQISHVLDQAAQTVFLVWHDVSQAQLANDPAQIANKTEITPRIAAAVQQLATECFTQRKIQAAPIGIRANNESKPETEQQEGPLQTSGHVVSVPILVDAEVIGVLTTCFFADSYPGHWLTAIAETAASAIGLSMASQRNSKLERELAATAAILDLAIRVESADSFEEAGRILCEELARHIGCPLVVTGFNKGRQCRVLAVSGSTQVLDPSRNRLFEAALDEVTIRETTIVWPARPQSDRHSLLTLKQLAEAEDQKCVVGIPIRDHSSDVLGAWLFLGDFNLRDESGPQDFIRACEHRIGTSLFLVKNAQRSRWTKLLRSIGTKSTRSISKTMFVIVLLVAAVLAVPIPYRVACDTELQPITRRFVAAPFDVTLKKTHVEPGDVVLRNQLLATLDDREISIELKTIDADYHRAQKERDTHLAERDIAAAQLSGFDMDRLNQRKELLLHRTENLEIRSPFDGLVLDGDLRKSEGVPLKTGKTLFEIAPLERMLVEIAIPEADIRYVSVGQMVELRLNAFPDREVVGALRRIHPRSEIRDDQHVFIGEIELKNTNTQMLPGMQGQARIVAESHSLAWILFHKPYESFLMWMGW